MNNKALLAARIRQLLAIDRNASVVYTELARMVEDEPIKNKLKQIAREESFHVATSLRLLKLLDAV